MEGVCSVSAETTDEAVLPGTGKSSQQGLTKGFGFCGFFVTWQAAFIV